MSEPDTEATGWGERTSNDVAGLAIELSRLIKALCFYGSHHANTKSLIQRGFLVWKLEIDRAGAVELSRRDESLSAADCGPFGTQGAADLIEAMQRHGIDSLRFESEIDEESFAEFASLLSQNASSWDHPSDRFASQLYATTAVGIEVNGESRAAAPVPGESSVPATASLGSLLIGNNTGGLRFDLTAFAPAADGGGTPPPPSATPPSPQRPTMSSDSSDSSESGTWPTIEEDPLEAPSTGMAGERLKISLRELDRCTDDGLYSALIDRVKETSRALFDEGHHSEIYRTLLVLSDHAAGQSGCSGAQIMLAQSAMEELARPVDGPLGLSGET